VLSVATKRQPRDPSGGRRHVNSAKLISIQCGRDASHRAMVSSGGFAGLVRVLSIMGAGKETTDVQSLKAALLLRGVTAGSRPLWAVPAPPHPRKKTGRKNRAKTKNRAKNQTNKKAGQGLVRDNWVGRSGMALFQAGRRRNLQEKTGATSLHSAGGAERQQTHAPVAGKIDLSWQTSTLMSFDAVANHVPVVSIAAIFQKDRSASDASRIEGCKNSRVLKPLT